MKKMNNYSLYKIDINIFSITIYNGFRRKENHQRSMEEYSF